MGGSLSPASLPKSYKTCNMDHKFDKDETESQLRHKKYKRYQLF